MRNGVCWALEATKSTRVPPWIVRQQTATNHILLEFRKLSPCEYSMTVATQRYGSLFEKLADIELSNRCFFI